MTTNERNEQAFDLYRYAIKDYQRTLVFKNDAAWQLAALSPDDRYLALVKPRTSADSDVYLLDLAVKKHAPQLITKHEGNVQHDVYAFTRDSKQLVYATDEFGEFNEAWTYDLASGAKAALVKDNWDVQFLFYSESGRYRVWGVNDDARTAVHIFDSTSGKEVTLPDLPGGRSRTGAVLARRIAARAARELRHFAERRVHDRSRRRAQRAPDDTR